MSRASAYNKKGGLLHVESMFFADAQWQLALDQSSIFGGKIENLPCCIYGVVGQQHHVSNVHTQPINSFPLA